MKIPWKLKNCQIEVEELELVLAPNVGNKMLGNADCCNLSHDGEQHMRIDADKLGEQSRRTHRVAPMDIHEGVKTIAKMRQMASYKLPCQTKNLIIAYDPSPWMRRERNHHHIVRLSWFFCAPFKQDNTRKREAFLRIPVQQSTQDTDPEGLLPCANVIQNWVPLSLPKKCKVGLESDYGASIDQFFECFDEFRSSQATLGKQWNMELDLFCFQSITVASNLASGSTHIPTDQSSIVEIDGANPDVHHLDARFQHVTLNLQIHHQKMNLEASVIYKYKVPSIHFPQHYGKKEAAVSANTKPVQSSTLSQKGMAKVVLFETFGACRFANMLSDPLIWMGDLGKLPDASAVRKASSSKGDFCAPSTSIHAKIGSIDGYLVTSQFENTLDEEKCSLDQLLFSAKKVFSMTTGTNDHHYGISMLWQKGPVTGPWMLQKVGAWSMATSHDQRSRNNVTGEGYEFSSVKTAEDLGETNSHIRQELVLSSAFLLGVHLSQVWINLGKHDYELLNQLLSNLIDGLPDKTHGIDINESFENSPNDSSPTQVSILVECDLLDLCINLDSIETSCLVQKELQGSWNNLRLTVGKFELLSVLNIGGIVDANFLWMNHGEGELRGSIVDRDKKPPFNTQDLLLISCSNSTIKRGDGEGANALSFGSAGTTITHIKNPTLHQIFTSITLPCGTFVVPGECMDWISALSCFFTLPQGPELADSDNSRNRSDADDAVYISSFFLELVDIALSFEPHKFDEAVQPVEESCEKYVACLLAAASLNAGFVKVAHEALVGAILRIKGVTWEIECQEAHINLDSCSDTTDGLSRLVSQLQQLYAPDLEDALVHLQSRWNTVQQEHSRIIDEGDTLDRLSVKLSSENNLSTSSEDVRSVGLLDEIHENAFYMNLEDGSALDHYDSHGLNMHFPGDNCGLNSSNGISCDTFSPNIPHEVPMHRISISMTEARMPLGRWSLDTIIQKTIHENPVLRPSSYILNCCLSDCILIKASSTFLSTSLARMLTESVVNPNEPNDVEKSEISGKKKVNYGKKAIVEEALLPFFQASTCDTCVDLAALRGGNYAELLNLVPWKGIDLQLKHVCAVGVYGWNSICETVVGQWLEDISHNQVHKLLKGLPPIRSLYAVSSGASKLVSLPIKSYKKDHKLLKGMQRGARAFIRSISLEAVGLGVHLAAGAHEVLLQTEYILTSIPPSMPSSERDKREMTVRSNQPKDAQQGIRRACESISDGLGRTASALVGTPFKTYQRGGGAGPALVTAIRAAPAAAMAPVSASARAVHCALLGVRNSLDPEHKKESMEKYLGHQQ
ncbi:hypothetical protein J5N97_011880 [Dioscorea zingiberensis]|uniref:Autophagy-related protein 2 n=1 Tax=Dioscorea zingiberensis TaxID=325984 RepID=A0A9D5HNS0_9LILI|nr:hypothetical protein J5N97_011880 [Dioscorea zingiberensis]